ncbi:MAG TPA: hypothetical protein PKE40_09935 [Arachnia sp.]|nr:hypothetical protein [Arachnia sp.]HMT86660.1 hypothetical protein [Arachnia sp.]
MSRVLLCARDASLIEAVESTTLALGVELCVARGMDEISAMWSGAAMRLVAPEMAGRVAGLGPSPGPAYIVGRQEAELVSASAALGLPVLALPAGGSRLAEAITQAATARGPSARVIALAGASGGLGTSTLTVALAARAAAGGAVVSVVELDPCGGGLDLLLGAETQRGFRWPDLQHVRGELEDLRASLPCVEGIAVLSARHSNYVPLASGAVAAVLASLRRTNDYVFLDLGLGAAGQPAEVEEFVLLIGADVRSVSAARMRTAMTGARPTRVAVRSGPGRRVPPGKVAEALGLPLLGELRHDDAVPRLAEMGMLLAGRPARRLTRDASSFWKRLADD